MSEFYTNCLRRGDYIHERYIDEYGNRKQRKTLFKPKLYLSTQKETQFKTLQGDYVQQIECETISEATQRVKDYSGSNVSVYGHDIGWNYTYLVENYRGELQFDPNKIRIFYFDIETEVSVGVPDPRLAEERINVFTIYDSLTNQTHVWLLYDQEFSKEGLLSYVSNDGKVNIDPDNLIIHDGWENDEYDMLSDIISFWKENFPDIITGWNIETFDIPYIVNRIIHLFGEKTLESMSPYKSLSRKKIVVYGEDTEVYTFDGIASIDYIPLYKKITLKNHESFKLDFISTLYLDKGKLNYDGSFQEFYTNEFEKFVAYNIVDVHLVKELEEKLSLFTTTFGVSYLSKTNFEDIFGAVKVWDVFIFDYLYNNGIVPPNKSRNDKVHFDGAFVRDPIVGSLQEWVLSFDVNSMYPHIIMGWNMSPETIIGTVEDVTPDVILNGEFDFENDVPEGVAVAANGAAFSTEKFGVMPTLTKLLYDGRSFAKKESGRYKKEAAEFAKTTGLQTPEEKAEYSRMKQLFMSLNIKQNALKVLLNSLFGASGNVGFRYYDLRIAHGITATGQMIIRWAGNSLDDYFTKLTGKPAVVYQDTDSIYVSFKNFVDKFIKPGEKSEEEICSFLDTVAQKKIEPFLENVFEEISSKMGCSSNYIHMKREAIARSAVWFAKKRYVLYVMDMEGFRYETPELKLLGVDAVKSSTPQLVRDKILAIYYATMAGQKSKLESLIDAVHTDFMNAPVQDISFPRGVNNLAKYENPVTIYKKGDGVTTPIHVRGALLYNHCLKKYGCDIQKYPPINSGQKMKFCYLKEPNTLRENVIGFENELPVEFGLHKYVNRELQYEKAFISNVRELLDGVGWSDVIETTGSIF